MSSLTHWKRLVRYLGQDGQVRYGEPQTSDHSPDMLTLLNEDSLTVEILEGKDVLSAKPTGEKEKVQKLLAPLTETDVPFVRCIGLNYKTHILETGRPLPTCPTIFVKPGTAISGPLDEVPIPRIAQAQCDYEGELTVLIGKDAKNVPEEDALDYVAAYTVGNDVSARDWQRDADKAGPVPQWSFSKSFDKYAPIGPCLVSPTVLGAADKLSLTTHVNGELRQSSNTADLCFDVRKIIAFCSQGQTLQAGSLIMTGTPGGVGLFMKPPQFLKDGDQVTVAIEGIGHITNTISFE